MLPVFAVDFSPLALGVWLLVVAAAAAAAFRLVRRYLRAAREDRAFARGTDREVVHGTTDDRVAEHLTADLLSRYLTRLPGVRVFHGLAWPGSVFADVDPLTGNVTSETLDAVITPRTTAVIAVHQGGTPFDVDDVQALCDKRGVPLVHDSACAAGSTYRGGPVSSGAALAAWSFHPRKLLTTGEGGMVTTGNAEWATRLRKLREHGMSVSAAERHAQGSVKLESYEEVGFNFRMTDMQAAVGLIQLRKLPDVIAKRRELAERYHKLLGELDGVRCVADPEYGTTNYQSFWVVLPDDYAGTSVDVLTALQERGVSGRRGIMASHLEPAYAGAAAGDLPVTEHLTSRSVILPLYHQMTEAEQDTVVSAFTEALRGAL
ncbi:DegT/DnrJ/EryC1/StrS family aminotransferase [Saccharothrix sp. MB29]|nr:DegT/DnrJ/EryC1/StrS family aminotransferase [Saccharothrix sp. MB29]